MQTIAQILAAELAQPVQYVENVIALLDEGSTIPFIARYRKEQHGSMDDTTLRKLEDRLQYLRNLDKRRQEVKSAIDGQGKLTDELAAAIDNAGTLAEVEDLYRPYKQKRRTRATVAREKGLEPLALLLLAQEKDCPAPEDAAQAYIDPEKGVETPADALQGANDIIAEIISDDADIRKALRGLLMRQGRLKSVAATEEDSVYRLYYDFEQPLPKLAGHQILAVNRGEKEGFLSVTVLLDRDAALPMLRRAVVKPGSSSMAFLRDVCEDAYDRLIYPSLEREARSTLTESACEGAIGQFALNLKPLLLQPPVKGHVTMGLDPGYAHGCKVAVIDGTGKVLDTTVVYPTYGERQKKEAIARLTALCRKHGVAHIAIGNGTASRETEQMTVDPKAIGVGQYQHDMPPKRLDETLGGVVEDCVNAVGVDVNTASASLLGYVSGLNGTTARNIVAYREANGAFPDRKRLLKVPKLGPKAYEQCAGFLRVPESKNVLDNTGVHPESYGAAEELLALCGFSDEDVRRGAVSQLMQKVQSMGEAAVAEKLGVGVPTLRDVVKELMKPGRDLRSDLPAPILRTDVLEIKDLKPGMVLTGTVRNVIDFGVFVDIGVHQDGLVHISQVCNKFIKHPSEVVAVGDIVKVVVLDVDEKKHRISLSMKQVKE